MDMDIDRIMIYLGREASFLKSKRISSLAFQFDDLDDIIHIKKILLYSKKKKVVKFDFDMLVPKFDSIMKMEEGRMKRQKILGK